MKVTPADYALIFEDNKVGAAVFEDLVARFYARQAVTKGGIDAVLDTYHRAGQGSVLNFIVSQLKRSHGKDPNETEAPAP